MTRQQIDDAAQIVRQSVSAKAYGDLIGLKVDHAGFCSCPFHAGDRTASLKLYDGPRGWHCFGCGASGDVIELAKRLYSLRYPQAVCKVAQDAGLRLPGMGTISYEESLALQAAKRREVERSQREQAKEKVEKIYWKAFDRWWAAEKTVLALEDAEKVSQDGFSEAFCKALEEREAARETLKRAEIWRDSI